MAVSYVSQVFRNSPYVPPVDLNLLGKVLSYKQGLFDQNAMKIQDQINQASNLDVIKGEDREYITGKINNLVNNLNKMGGMDLSDYNVSNQIESYGSEIYNDDKVISAISSTKRIRNLQNSYEKLRTDPKSSKFYSDANYTLDMDNVQKYLSDGQVGSSYNGNSTATPYYDYNKEFNDAFKNHVTNKYSQITPDGYYIRKETGEYIRPEQVAQEARGLMSMNARGQMERDATYLYKFKAGWGKQQIVDKALQTDYQDILNTKDYIAQTEKDLTIEQDPNKKSQLKKNLQNYKDILKKQSFDFGNNKYDYEKKFDENPTELMYKGFSDDYFKALGLKNSFQKTTSDLVADPVKAMLFRANEQRYLKGEEFRQEDKLLDKRLQAERDNTILKAQLDADKAHIDPATGEVIQGSAEPSEDIKANTSSLDESELYKSYKDWTKNGYVEQVNQLADNLWQQIVADNPELKDYFSTTTTTVIPAQAERSIYTTSPTTGAAVETKIPASEQQVIKKTKIDERADVNKDGRIDIRDFQQTINGKPAYEYVKGVKQRQILANAVTALSDLANGRPSNISKLPQGTAEFVEQMNLLNQKKKNYETAIGKYESGQEGFLRDQYAAKIIPSDEKTQGSKGVSFVKSYLMQNAKLDGTPIINEVGPSLDGSNNFSLYYSIKDSKGNIKPQSPVNIPPDVARQLGMQGGNYDILNTTVDLDNDFKSYIQNTSDPSFVSQIRIYKYGNNNEYKVHYYMPDGTLVNLPAYPGSNYPLITSSAALAYDSAKRILQEFGNTLDKGDRKDLKSRFENLLKTSGQ